MIKYLLAAILALGAALVWSVNANQHAASQIRALTEASERAVAASKADRAALVARQAKIASQARKLAQAQQGLSEALQREKAWSDTQVPKDVQEALAGRSGKPDSGPVGLLDH